MPAVKQQQATSRNNHIAVESNTPSASEADRFRFKVLESPSITESRKTGHPVEAETRRTPGYPSETRMSPRDAVTAAGQVAPGSTAGLHRTDRAKLLKLSVEHMKHNRRLLLSPGGSNSNDAHQGANNHIQEQQQQLPLPYQPPHQHQPVPEPPIVHPRTTTTARQEIPTTQMQEMPSDLSMSDTLDRIARAIEPTGNKFEC